MTGIATRPARRAGTASPRRPLWRRRPVLGTAAAVTAVAVLFGVYTVSRRNDGPAAAGRVAYDVGSPSSGPAPALALPTTDGGTFNLAAYRGRSVLLYFQEGLMCQACWTQLKDLEAAQVQLRGLGVDQLLTVTTDPVELLARKVRDDGYSTPVASDASTAVSKQYGTLGIGMMGGSMNGHSFLLVGPDGSIRWRADYGGAPNYTMYVPVQQLLADLRAGTGRG